MLDVSYLYCGSNTGSVPHRYGRDVVGGDAVRALPRAENASDRRPVVVWNVTRVCNLKCRHCYTDSHACRYPDELSTIQCKAVLEDLAAFQVPVVLFSGGEPLMRPDIEELLAYARSLGLRIVLSTNGTRIDQATASKIHQLGVSYVGISLDSAVPEIHDRFRGVSGAFDRTMAGFRYLATIGQKVGLRLTLTPETASNLDRLFDFIERERINRACFYHLCPAGRGRELNEMSNGEVRRAIDQIFDHTRDMISRGRPIEVLTVDNHCDGAWLYLRLLREDPERAEDVLKRLLWNGGARFSSGVGIANIDSTGNVHADQFSMFRSFGNVIDRPFSDIWRRGTDPILAGLRDRLPLLKGRCADCRFKAICGGGLRARAEILTGDPWAADPACYLTDEEIAGKSITPPI